MDRKFIVRLENKEKFLVNASSGNAAMNKVITEKHVTYSDLKRVKDVTRKVK